MNTDPSAEGEVFDLFDNSAFSMDFFSKVENKVEGLKVAVTQLTDDSCVSEGLFHDMPYVFNYKNSHGELYVGNLPLEVPLYSADSDFDETIQPNFEKSLLHLVVNLRKAPFKYLFSGHSVKIIRKIDENGNPEKEVTLSVDKGKSVFSAWGHTPEEAYDKLFETSLELARVGLTTEIQDRIFELQDIGSEPINEDNRVFPSPEPQFIIMSD